jgi:hypothetical protein
MQLDLFNALDYAKCEHVALIWAAARVRRKGRRDGVDSWLASSGLLVQKFLPKSYFMRR